MEIKIHAVPVERDGHKMLRITSPVEIINSIEPDRYKLLQTTALWDTGATNTCIPMKTALAMGIRLGELSPTTKIKTIEGARQCQFYLRFPSGESIFVADALAMPNMQARFVIGMDIISRGKTTIEPDGEGGVYFTFSI